MADMDMKIEDHTKEVLAELERRCDLVLTQWGLAGVRNATAEINAKIYDKPPSGNYKRTGRLRGSITYATKKDGSSPASPASSSDGVHSNDVNDDREVVIGTNVEYAQPVELGSSKVKARPFIKPAIQNHKDDYKKILEDTLTGGI